MTISLLADRLIETSDAKAILTGGVDDPMLPVLINALTGKARAYMNRRQLKADATTAVTEWLRAHDGMTLYLHASPLILTSGGANKEVTATIYDDQGAVHDTYTYHAGSDFRVVSDDYHARLECYAGNAWPTKDESYLIKVEYYAGWNPIPGDVLQGALMQLRVDLARMRGEAGVQSRGRQSESASYETEGLIAAVRSLWSPYVVRA